MTNLNDPIFTDAKAAREHIEALRWPDGPYCPHCGEAERCSPVKGKSHRPGLYYCLSCKKQFTVTVGTLFERSKIPLHKWMLGFHLMASSKKGISAHQLHRMLGITYKSAWFMAHRIREAMRDDGAIPLGGNGGDVEVDETFIGRDPDVPTPTDRPSTWHERIKVLSLVDRQSGRARTFVVDSLSRKDIEPIIRTNILKETRLLSDEAPRYKGYGKRFDAHGYVNHSIEEWVSRSDPTVHTQTIEGFFSIFKRGMKGVYQHASKRHMHRYTAEFDFRYSNRSALGVEDDERRDIGLKGISGKRLMYQQPHSANNA